MHTIASYNLSQVLIHTPQYAILIVVVPMLTIAVLKGWNTTRASKSRLEKKEWVISREHDEEGIPLLAETVMRSHRDRGVGAPISSRAPRF
jgi:hypothetical protein